MTATASGPERWGLMAGVAVPFIYYGIQLAVLPGYPDYDVTRQVASELGGPESAWAGAFNAGILVLGVLTLIAAGAQWTALRRQGVNFVLSTLPVVAMSCFGVATLLAGFFPLPDPRHASGSPLLLGALSYPILMLIVCWRRRGWRIVFAVCVLAILAAALIMASGVVDRVRWAGLVQRPLALTMTAPLALGALALLRGAARWS